MNWLPIFVIVAVVLLIFYFQKCSLNCGLDNFGMDPSVRMAAGIAGPDLGDPIGQFAREIGESKAHFREKADRIGCKNMCMQGRAECIKCFNSRETLVIGVMPDELPSNLRSRREGHAPWTPPDMNFDENFRNGSSCMACS